MALMFAVTFIAGATLAPRADRLLNPPAVVPEFQLVDQAGKNITRDALLGRVWVGSFFFSRCSDNCPKMTARLTKLGSMIDPAAELVSFTMDPAHDTPEALATYAREA